MLLKLCVIVLALSPALLFAQDAPTEEAAAPVVAKEDVKPIDAIMAATYVNSMQFLFDGERWYVLSILWDAESETQELPPEYLSESK